MQRSATAAVVLITAALSACTELGPTAPFDPPQQAAGTPGRAHTVGQDAEFTAIARAVPGFGGMFVDADGRLNVYMTPALQSSANAQQNALARIDRALTRRGSSLADYDVVVLDGARDFLQLQEYQDRMLALLAMPGVVFTDIDEMNNRMRVGVLDGTDPARIDQALAMAGVPTDVVALETASPFLPVNTLRDPVDPKGGGLQLVWQWPGTSSFFICTLGFNALSSHRGRSEPFFFTNSHCTGDMGVVQGTQYYQPLPPQFGAGMLVGTEFLDPPFFPCFGSFVCRFSDAALVRYNREVSVKHGAIHRTKFVGTDDASGSIEIEDAGRPMFDIAGAVPFPLAGEVLDKVGRTTGWTRGPVVLTCINLLIDAVLLCQDVVVAAVSGGDSGSPVFRQLGNDKDVLLYGIVWGEARLNTGQRVFVFSAMENIALDFEPVFGAFRVN